LKSLNSIQLRKTRYHFRVFVFAAIIFFLKQNVSSQSLIPVLDSLKFHNVKHLMNRDSTTIYTDDSVYFYTDSLSLPIKNNSKYKTKAFYDSIRSKANNYWLLKEVYNLILCNPNSTISIDNKEIIEFENQFSEFEGKIIKQIHFYKLDIFAFEQLDSVSITKSKLRKFLNKTHVNTQDRVLRNNLLFAENELLKPDLMADNERILRDISYINEARFLVIPASQDSVDIFIITKDVFSAALDGKYHNKDSMSISFFNNNIFGTGHKFSNDILMNRRDMKPVGYNANYKVANIAGSFIEGKLIYDNAFDITNYEIDLKRNFLAKKFQYAGGINLKQSKIIESNLNIKNDTVKFNYLDFWLGRAFQLPSFSNKILKKSQIIVSGRFLRKEFCERPPTDFQTNKKYHRRSLHILSVALSKRNYYKSNLIYEYGRTEDIPYGYLLELIGAYELNEFSNRHYSGIRFSAGKLKNFGYIYGNIDFGGFFEKTNFQQGNFLLKTQYFSHLQTKGRYHFRHFIDIEYLIGINRFEDELLFLSNNTGIRGINSDLLVGTNRFSLNLESIVFTPWHFYGFKFAFFSFLDIGTIGHDLSFVFDEKYYSAIGLGFRIRNENLLFKTFQFRIAYYPSPLSETSNLGLHLSGKNVHQFEDFELKIPAPFVFE
jgi:hypothetical protein